MPNTREKLIELITDKENDLIREIVWFTDTYRIKEVADHLIANGVTVQEWISVKDRLPEKWQHVLAASKCGDAYSIDFDHICSTGEWYGNLETEYKVTHWQPLPEPPKGE